MISSKIRHKMSDCLLRGFTLIELLVVISIIALLVAILMPALGKARAQAQMIVCQTNLKQYGIGMFMYLDDNDGKFPYPWWWLHEDPASKTPTACLWHNEAYKPDGQLWPYLKSEDVHMCPTAYKNIMRAETHSGHDPSVPLVPQFSYSMSSYLGGNQTEIGWNYANSVKKVSEVKRTLSEVGMIGEENLELIRDKSGTAIHTAMFNDNVMLISPRTLADLKANPYPFADCIGAFHGKANSATEGKTNMIFLDSHVGTVRPIDSLNATFPKKAYFQMPE